MKKVLLAFLGLVLDLNALLSVSGHWLWTGQMVIIRNVAPSSLEMSETVDCLYFTGWSLETIEIKTDFSLNWDAIRTPSCSLLIKSR